MEDQMQILLEKIQEQMDRQTISITKAVTENISQQLDERFKMLEEQNQNLQTEVSELKEKIKGLESQKKKNNLLFFGITEGSEEDKTIVKFMKEKINTHLSLDIQEYEIDKAYRIGQKMSNGLRPILISFTSNWRRNLILKNKKKLPEGIYIKEDFTKETLEIRKSLQPKLEEERNKGNIAYLRGEKLIVKKPSDVQKSEKRKRESSYSPNQNQHQQPSSGGPKKIAAKNAFELMTRPRSNSLKEKINN
ncbi:hypothetical protein PYW07_006472 [Mythimna separata]|uniref:Endonuclease-reverse transcriptase n=1 Tax=Mythimna separata TaxID=271217 RepID=A0AAD7YDD5_MYTSE|nr:hypothetical protein PYW07_008404 [Mythimna separata]KAJ8728776.1 hypothetical protein PYW07_006472 [Mythimna separata]